MGLAFPGLGRRRFPAAAVAGSRAIDHDERPDDDDTLVSITRQYAHYATVGIMFPVAIALGFMGGYALDRWLGTTPLLAFIGLGFGVAAAIRNLLQTVASDDDSQP